LKIFYFQVTKVSADENGRMVVNFETRPQFLGSFILTHKYLAGIKSELVPPPGIYTNFSLKLLWSQPTWERPRQEWRAVSEYSLMVSFPWYSHLWKCIVVLFIFSLILL
jgi:hypothetical protein